MIKNGLQRILRALSASLAPALLLIVRWIVLDCSNWTRSRRCALLCVASILVRLGLVVIVYWLLNGLLAYLAAYYLSYYLLLRWILPAR